MSFVKKCLFFILTLLPLASISFASEKGKLGLFDSMNIKQFENDFIVQLDNEQLPDAYYRILDKYGIHSTEEFLLPENKEFKKDLLDKFLIEVMMKKGGGSRSWG